MVGVLLAMQLAPSMAGLPERWWFRSDVNCATRERMGAWENMSALKVRLCYTACNAPAKRLCLTVCMVCMYFTHANCHHVPVRLLQKRVGEFRMMLQSQQHKVIVCVGHSTFFREFMNTGRGTRLRNCELHTQYL